MVSDGYLAQRVLTAVQGLVNPDAWGDTTSTGRQSHSSREKDNQPT
jgi:hypothetical protein